jgi:hypothetical protein
VLIANNFGKATESCQEFCPSRNGDAHIWISVVVKIVHAFGDDVRVLLAMIAPAIFVAVASYAIINGVGAPF